MCVMVEYMCMCNDDQRFHLTMTHTHAAKWRHRSVPEASSSSSVASHNMSPSDQTRAYVGILNVIHMSRRRRHTCMRVYSCDVCKQIVIFIIRIFPRIAKRQRDTYNVHICHLCVFAYICLHHTHHMRYRGRGNI